MSVIVYVIAGIITVVLAVVWDLIFVDGLGMEWLELLRVNRLMILCAVVSLLVGLIAMSIRGVSCNAHGHYPHVFPLVFMLFVNFVLLGGAGVVYGYLRYDVIVSLCESNELYILLVLAPPALCGAQLMFFLCGWKKYASAEKCPECKRLFCLKETSRHTTGEEYDTYSYTDTTRNEKIGSIGSIDVRANVTERTYHKTHHTKYKVYYKCQKCGHEGSYITHKTHTENY